MCRLVNGKQFIFLKKRISIAFLTGCKTNLMTGDFEAACKDCKKGDFVFFDSPYFNTFDTYQKDGFSEADHKRLKALFDELTRKGVYCMLTNSNEQFIKRLYSNYYIKVVGVKRSINRDSSNRTGQEVIITNYDVETSVIVGSEQKNHHISNLLAECYWFPGIAPVFASGTTSSVLYNLNNSFNSKHEVCCDLLIQNARPPNKSCSAVLDVGDLALL